MSDEFFPPLAPDRADLIRPLTDIRATRQLYRWNMGCNVGIYFLFLRWALVYVGQSVNVPSRLNSHRWASLGKGAGKPIPFNKVAVIEVPRYWLDEIEGHYIETYRPPFNVRGIPQ